MTHTYLYWSPPCLAAPPPTERTWSHPIKIFDGDCTTSYVLNSGVKIVILQSVGPFHGAIVVPSVTRCRCHRRCRLCGHRCAGGVRQYSGDTWWIGMRRLVVANGPNIFQMLLVLEMPTQRMKIVVKLRANREILGRKLIKFGCDVAGLLTLNLLKVDLQSANPLLNAEARSKGRSTQRRLYNFLCLKLRGHWTESRQMSARCTKWLPITLLKSKLHFNSVNSEITGRKFTKFGHDVAWLLPLKSDLRSVNPLSNAKAKSKGHSMRRLWTSSIFY